MTSIVSVLPETNVPIIPSSVVSPTHPTSHMGCPDLRGTHRNEGSGGGRRSKSSTCVWVIRGGPDPGICLLIPLLVTKSFNSKSVFPRMNDRPTGKVLQEDGG